MRTRRYCPSCDALVNGRTGRVDCRLCGADTEPWPDDEPYRSSTTDWLCYVPDGTEPEPEPRATACHTCGTPLRAFDATNTSTWRTDDFCSARCKRRRHAPLARRRARSVAT